MSRPFEGAEQKAQRRDTVLISNVSHESFFLYAILNGVGVNFLIDTGAAVSLIHSNVWHRLSGVALETWTGPRLVSADGSALHILGGAKVTLRVGEAAASLYVVVTDNLATEGILGIDFLGHNRCVIDLSAGTLTLADGKVIPMLHKASIKHDIRIATNIRIPPRSEIEVTGNSHSLPSGIWLLEGQPLSSHRSVVAARAVLKSSTDSVPVRLLNTGDQTVVIHKGTKLGELEEVEEWQIGNVSEQADLGDLVTPEKRDILLRLAESSTSTSQVEKTSLASLLLQYADIFAGPGEQLGRTTKLKHTIDTGTAPPIRQHMRRVPPAHREVVKELLSQMKQNDVIQPSSSAWASPIVLVKKKDGGVRFCVDFRRVNEVTRKDAYPLPRIDDTLETLSQSQLFSTLDLASGYWQVELAEGSRAKTAFSTTEGFYEFKVMPFGLCNAPATFQRLMDIVLSGLQWSNCLVYLDDIIVMGKTFQEHITNMEQVFARIREAGLKIKPDKCFLLREQVRYLGHIVSKNGIEADPEKTTKVKNWPPPLNVREVQQFLGFANYYRRFIKNFAEIARPLHKLTERGAAQFQWTPECQRSFDLLRNLLSSPPILVYPDFTKPFILDTDASNEGIGAVLSQLDAQGKERVVAYGSRVLSKAERNYCATRKELLAVVTFIIYFRPYLLGHRFQLRTDHSSLQWLYRMKEPEGQVARWLEKLQQFEFQIVHRKGLRHTNADALSRLPCTQCGLIEEQDEEEDVLSVAALQLSGLNMEEIRKMQAENDEWKLLMEARKANIQPVLKMQEGRSIEFRRLCQIWDQLALRDGVMYRKYFDHKNPSSFRYQLLVPQALRKRVLEETHDGFCGGHLGEEKSFQKLKLSYYWPGYWNSVRDWCRTCAACASRKTPAPKNKAPLQSIVVGSPMQMVAIDILGPLPQTQSGNKYVLVAGDYFTKWMEAYAIPNQEASTIAQKLLNEMFCRFSLPEKLHSDQGRQFESEIIKQLCRLLKIEKSRTTPYHPQSDGFVERFNRTLLNLLSTASGQHQPEWDMNLSKLCLAYNTSVQSTTGYSPFFLMFGREARLPIDICHDQPTSAVPASQQYGQYVLNQSEAFLKAFEAVRQNVSRKQCHQQELYNRRVHGDPFSTGDLVWLFNPAVGKGQSRKLLRPWTGPYRVQCRLSDVTYWIQHTGNNKTTVVHFDRLKACPKDIRLPARENRDDRQAPPPAPPPASAGPTLQLVPEDDDEDAPPEPVVAAEHDIEPEPAAAPIRRYPDRIRRPPDRL